MTGESDIKAHIRLVLGKRAPHARLFNSPTGEAWAGKTVSHDGHLITLAHAYRITYGLAVGSGDLCGWCTVVVTPDMVGRRIAVFTSGETKTARGRPSPDQVTWRNAVLAAGGRAEFLRNEDDALALVRAT